MIPPKSIKIPRLVHKELKAFIGLQESENIIDFAGYAIIKELKARGHKFIHPKEFIKFNPNNK